MANLSSASDNCTVVIHRSYEKTIDVPYDASLTEARQAVADTFMPPGSHDLSKIMFATSSCGFRSYVSDTTTTSDVDISDVDTSDVDTTAEASDTDTSNTDIDDPSNQALRPIKIGSIDQGAAIHAIFPCHTYPAQGAVSHQPHNQQAMWAMEGTRESQHRLEMETKKWQETLSNVQEELGEVRERLQTLETTFRKTEEDLDHVKFRFLLDLAQEELASVINTSDRPSVPSSHTWREILKCRTDSTRNTMRRKTFALSILTEAVSTHSQLIHSDAAMNLLCQKKSSIRTRGNGVAHPSIDATSVCHLRALQARIEKTLPSFQREGMRVIIDFFISKYSSSSNSDSDSGDSDGLDDDDQDD